MPLSITITADNTQGHQALGQAQADVSKFATTTEQSFQRMAAQIRSSTQSMVSGLQALAKEVTRMNVEQGNLSKAFIQTGQAATTPLNAFQKLQQQMHAADQASAKLSTGFQGLSRFAQAFGVTLGIVGIVQFARSVVDAGLQMNRFERTLQAATGSLDGSKRAMAFLMAESNRLGQSLSVMIPTFVQLTAATRGTMMEGERTRELFTALVGAGQAVGLSTEGVGRAMIGLTQIISQNAIQLDEFRNQFASQVPGAMRETAIALGQMGVTANGTIAEMLTLMSKQKLSVNDLMAAVTTGLKEVQKTAPDMANTAEAAFAKFNNAVLKLKADLANSGILEFLSSMANRASSLLEIVSRSLGVGVAGQLRQFDLLNDKVTALIEKRDQFLAEAKDPLGFDPAAAAANAAAMDQELRQTLEIIKQQHALRDAKAGAASDAEAQGKASRDDERKQLDAINAQAALVNRIGDASSVNRAKIKAEMADLDVALAAIANKDTAMMIKIGIDPTSATDIQQAHTQLLKDRQVLQDKLANVDKQGGSSRHTVASETTRAEVEVIEASLKRQLDLTKQGFDERRQLSDQELSARLAAGESYVDIEREAASRRKTIAIEEARTIEQTTVDMQQRLIAAENTRYAAAKAAAGNNAGVQAQVEKDHVKAVEDAQAPITAAKTHTAEVEQGLSKKTLDEGLKDAKVLADAKEKLAQQEIEGRLRVIDAQKGLVQAQVQGEVLSKAEGVEQMKALQQEEFDHAMKLLTRKAEAEIQAIKHRLGAEAEGSAEVQAIRERLAADRQALNIQQQTELQTTLNQEQRDYERFVERVTSSMATIFEGLLNRTLNVVDFFKQLFIKTISQLAAEIATKAIIVPIIGQVLGAVGGSLTAAGTGAAGGTGGFGDILSVLGLGKQAMSLWTDSATFLTSSIKSLDATMTNLLYGIDNLTMAESALAEGMSAGMSGDIAAGTGAGAGGPAFSTVGVAGGLAAMGGGIYAALNANNAASQAAYAASAAAGAFAAAAASGLLVAAGVTAATTGWTGFGLIAAAVLAAIGMILDTVIKPAGPRFAVSVGTGLGIGTDEKNLTVTGDLASEVERSERAGGEATSSPIQSALEAGVTKAVETMVGAINAVAVDASLLQGATQQALDEALSSALVLNSSNREKFQADIEAQLNFIPLQISGFFLKPLSDAFAQIGGVADIDEQIARFGVSVVGMAAIFDSMNTKIEELSQVANSDVRRSMGQLHEQMNAFALQLEHDAAAIATQITTDIVSMLEDTVAVLADLSTSVQTAAIPGMFARPQQAIAGLQAGSAALTMAGLDASGIEAQLTVLIQATVDAAFQVIDDAVASAPFDEMLQVILAIPPAIAALDPELATLQRMAQAFGVIVAPITQAITALENATQPLSVDLHATTEKITELQTAIVDAGDNLALLFPLYAELGQAIMEELALKQAQIQAQAAIIESSQQLIDSINTQLQGQGLTADAFANLAAEYAALGAELTEELAAGDVTAEAVIQTLAEMAAVMTEVISLAEQDLAAINAVQERVTQNIKSLVAATTPLDAQLAASVANIADLEAQIAVGGDPSEMTALYDELQAAIMETLDLQTQLINEELQGKKDAIEAQRQLLAEQITGLENTLSVQQRILEQSQALRQSVGQQVRGAAAPVQQAEAIRQTISGKQATLAGQTGEDALQTMGELQSLFTELSQLGEQTNQLHLIAEGTAGLSGLLPLIEAQGTLAAQQITTAEAQLQALEVLRDDTSQLLAAEAEAAAALAVAQAEAQAQLVALQAPLDAMAAYDEEIIALAEAELLAIQTLAEQEQAYAEAQLLAIAGTTNIDLAMLTVEQEALVALNSMQAELEALFFEQEAVKKALDDQTAEVKAQTELMKEQSKTPQPTSVSPIPLPVKEVNPSGGNGSDHSNGDQMGGLVSSFRWGGPLMPMHPADLIPMQRFAYGGYTKVMVEPGELVYGPGTQQQTAALETVNRMVPRFQVGGSGTGDTVPLTLPVGSFVLNRRAASVVQGDGYQGGGTVTSTSTSSAPVTVHITINLQATINNELDVRKVTDDIGRHLENRLTARLSNQRWGGR